MLKALRETLAPGRDSSAAIQERLEKLNDVEQEARAGLAAAESEYATALVSLDEQKRKKAKARLEEAQDELPNVAAARKQLEIELSEAREREATKRQDEMIAETEAICAADRKAMDRFAKLATEMVSLLGDLEAGFQRYETLVRELGNAGRDGYPNHPHYELRGRNRPLFKEAVIPAVRSAGASWHSQFQRSTAPAPTPGPRTVEEREEEAKRPLVTGGQSVPSGRGVRSAGLAG